MTAVLRPAIIERTLRSIVERICKEYVDNFTLIINIDPVGEEGCTQQDILKLAYEHFTHVRARMPAEPSFPLALKWCWEQVSAEYVLHAEDDFEFVKDIDINHMVDIMDKHQDLALLRFDRGTDWDNPKDDMIGPYIIRSFLIKKVPGRLSKRPLRWLYHEDGFYRSPGWKGCFATSSALMRSSFTDGITPFLEDGISPERVVMFAWWLIEEWTREKVNALRQHLKQFRSGLYAVPLAIKDQGRPWRKEQGLTKPDDNRGIGTTWIGGNK